MSILDLALGMTYEFWRPVVADAVKFVAATAALFTLALCRSIKTWLKREEDPK